MPSKHAFPSRQHQAVRDLEWVLASVPLLNNPFPNTPVHWWSHDDNQKAYQHSLEWLTELDKNPAPLHQLLAQQKDGRLGHYFETLIAFWLSWDNNPHYRLITQSLPVLEGKRTAGELDFLVANSTTGKIEHWEVAVKFYLGLLPSKHYKDWRGSGLSDRLDIKVNRLVDHQLTLGSHPSVLEFLAQQNLPETPPEPVCLLKGCLFYPFSARKNDWMPSHVTDKHLQGWWLSHDDFLATFSSEDLRWLRLPKAHWLSPWVFDTPPVSLPLTPKELMESLQGEGDNHAIAIAGFSAADTDGKPHYQEMTRGFVCSAAWLIKAGL